jgi:hypothetical protein
MLCYYCKKETYITHICPYCKEYFCLDHRDPKIHNCTTNQQMPNTPAKIPKLKLPEATPSTFMIKLSKNFFTFTFILVLLEEILRVMSYLRYSPYLEPNIYVVLLSQWITPYIASPIFFLTICFILFATKKLSQRAHPQNENSSILSKAVPIGIYATIAIIYAYAIANWILILLP